eukprot:GDKI01042119.1.p1 GENE.GDKI01042119.1~~GDKI01042119.1.p1  ORF type:complete len:252 (+),score=14.78 GDKI01042119.1:77-757(+)
MLLQLCILCLALVSLRCTYWVAYRWGIVKNRALKSKRPIVSAKPGPVRTMVVLGSGGHTTEMLQLIKDFDFTKFTFTFILAATDTTSKQKLIKTISTHRGMGEGEVERVFKFAVIPRSREVGQSWLTSLGTTLHSLLYSAYVVFTHQPQLLLTNGPGTCVPVCAAALLFECVLCRSVSIIFNESFCRTESLSLSGKILYLVVDRFIVSWQKLSIKYPLAEYMGVLY